MHSEAHKVKGLKPSQEAIEKSMSHVVSEDEAREAVEKGLTNEYPQGTSRKGTNIDSDSETPQKKGLYNVVEEGKKDVKPKGAAEADEDEIDIQNTDGGLQSKAKVKGSKKMHNRQHLK